MESEILINKGDKARAAARMGRQLLKLGISHQNAADAAHHELQHALADKGAGRIGLDVNASTNRVTPYYSAIGLRTPEEELIYTKAATDNPSESDERRIEELEKKIAKLKEKLLFA